MPASPADPAPALRADCSRCFALCCVALPFTASADFARDKAAGTPCPNLGGDHRCGIHDRLRPEGFTGCTVYDCFGAGQKVSQVTFGGRDWRAEPGTARRMFAAFGIMRQLHELLWYLEEALTLPPARPLRGELGKTRDEVERLTRGSAEELAEQVERKGMTLIPLRVRLRRGRAKLDIGVARGKKLYDKRHAEREKDARRSIERAMRERA